MPFIVIYQKFPDKSFNAKFLKKVKKYLITVVSREMSSRIKIFYFYYLIKIVRKIIVLSLKSNNFF